jgi:hypothetical protein
MIESNWEIRKALSAYHFNPKIVDPRWDCVIGLGRIAGDFDNEIAEVMNSARPVTWRTRSKTGEPNNLVHAEEYDLEKTGAGADLVLANFEYNIPEKFKEICELIGLENREDRVHVQLPGQVFNVHLDRLEKFHPTDPSKVMRIMIALSDWEPGQFNQYGNYTHVRYRKGDVYTFDWRHVPHSSANASLSPRVSLLTTGVVTEKTKKFLADAKNKSEIQI